METRVLDGLPPPQYRADSSTLRFWVATGEQTSVGASISASVLHYRFQGDLDGSNAALVYAANRKEIDDAVLRRVADGSREPVMLREYDLPRTQPAA